MIEAKNFNSSEELFTLEGNCALCGVTVSAMFSNLNTDNEEETMQDIHFEWHKKNGK